MINSTTDFEKVAKEEEKIFQNKLGIIRGFSLAKFSFAVKTTSDTQKIKEHIHETFVGIKSINEVVKRIPNFAYIFGSYRKGDSYNVITERIYGESMFEYIKSNRFSFEDYLMILIQVGFSIQVAQNTCGLVHYDLAPWNIVLQHLNESVAFDYVLGHDQIIRTKSKTIPVIIDYGKSHVINDDKHYGFINMYKFSTIQDMLTLLFTSLNEIITERVLSPDDIKNILSLANFVSGTTFRKEPFKSLDELKLFLNKERKYSELSYSNKYELEKIKPAGLAKYISKTFKYKLPYGKVKEYQFSMNKGNGRQVFDYILSPTREERMDSYLKVFSRIKHSTIPQPNNKFFVYYTAQSLEENLKSVGNFMIQYSTKKKFDTSRHERIYKTTMDFLHRLYDSKLKETKEEKIDYTLDSEFSKLKQAMYTEYTFLIPEKILEMIKPYKDNNLSSYKEIIEFILLNNGIYKLSEEDRKFYIENFSSLLKTESVNMRNNSANVKTLRDTSKELYTKDLLYIENNTKTGNCEDAKKYIEIYKNILSSLYV